MKSGRRVSAAQAFLTPKIVERPNLHVLMEAYVTKINLERDTATGVTFDWKNGKSYRIKAKREVLLAAGELVSPKLLMLSGIGPRSMYTKIP